MKNAIGQLKTEMVKSDLVTSGDETVIIQFYKSPWGLKRDKIYLKPSIFPVRTKFDIMVIYSF